ncbi:hypothetical protein Tco_1563152 [Tanacetum coccineum]
MLRRKRARKEQQQESSKKQRMEEDKETDEVEKVKEVEEDDEAELKKHLHEVFETFKVFQKEVENQLGKTIKSLRSDHRGYPKEMIGYSFYYPPENKFFVARNAEFLKNSLIAQQASGNLEDLEIIQEEDTHPSIDTSLNHEEDDQENDEPQSDINPFVEHELGDLGEPANNKAALLDPESDK